MTKDQIIYWEDRIRRKIENICEFEAGVRDGMEGNKFRPGMGEDYAAGHHSCLKALASSNMRYWEAYDSINRIH